jgi:threonine/homoserine/homoserine lactone efflux protein
VPYGPPQRIEDDPAMRWVLPVGTSGWAIAAGYLGLFSILCLPGPLAILCGAMAIRELRKNPKLSGWGRAIFGLVMGILGTLMMVLPFVLGMIGALLGK